MKMKKITPLKMKSNALWRLDKNVTFHMLL